MQTQQNLLDQKKRSYTEEAKHKKKFLCVLILDTYQKCEKISTYPMNDKKMRNTAPTNENNETVTIRKTRLLNHLIISINHKLHDKKNTMTYFIHYAKHENTLRLC